MLGLGGEVRYKTRLGRGETVAVMAGLASGLLEPPVSQVDPTILHQLARMPIEAADYGKRLMLTRDACRRELAMSLPERLMKDYPTHGYAISLDEAVELGLPVKPSRSTSSASWCSRATRRTKQAAPTSSTS